ncbi:MAG: site-specific integrase [Verrucomicrobiota bacterium]
MKTEHTGKPVQSKTRGKPWKIVKGACRSVPVYSWVSGGRTFFRVPISGGTPPCRTTTNQKTALDLAKVQADSPAQVAPTLGNLPTALLVSTAQAIQKLEPILTPLQISITAGLEEYAHLKARTGKLGLGELFDGVLAVSSAAENTPLPDRLREIAGAIAKLTPVLAPLNVSITSGIEEYAAVKERAGQADLRQLFEKLLDTPWLKNSQTGILEVAKAFLKERKDVSHISFEYYKGLYYNLSKLVEQVGPGTPIGAVTKDQLQQVIDRPDHKARSNKALRGHILTFFGWCQTNQYLDYTKPTAADALPAIHVPEPTPRILTAQEAKAILMEVNDPWCLLYLVMGLFTGIRHDELQRLTFNHINPGENVVLPAEITKTKKPRTIPIQPALDAWLAPFYSRAGLVIPVATIQDKVRRILIKSPQPGVPHDWKRNSLRQSYASYRLAQCRDCYTTAQEDGHYVYVLERVYKGLSTKEEAAKFFNLTPRACGKPDWNKRIKAFLADEPELQSRPEITGENWKDLGSKVRTRKTRRSTLSQSEPLRQAA